MSSTKVGAVRLNAQMITTDPISKEEFLQLQAYVRGRLEPNIDKLKTKLKEGETLALIGTSGTIKTLANLCGEYQYLQQLKNQDEQVAPENCVRPGSTPGWPPVAVTGALAGSALASVAAQDAAADAERL